MIEEVITGLERISLVAQLRDKVAIALDAHRPRCGNCQHWMKSRECPRERNVNGMSRGPNCEAPTCDKFEITPWALELQARRVAEAVEFAKAHGLPVPVALSKEPRHVPHA